MSKVNFEGIGTALRVFDTDKMNIGRRVEIVNPDGTIGETSTDIPLYSNVPCHISFVTADNTDPDSIDSKPIIVGLKIDCGLEVDLQNNDYITAFRLANDGTVLETYVGTIGFPSTSQGRKSVQMQMRTNV